MLHEHLKRYHLSEVMDEAGIKGIRTASLPACDVDCLGNAYVNRADRYGIKRKSSIFDASFKSAAVFRLHDLNLFGRKD